MSTATEEEQWGTRDKPINREPKPNEIIDKFLTTNDLAPYERNHGAIPTNLSSTAHKITVTFPISLLSNPSAHNTPVDPKDDTTTIVLTPSDLATKYAQHRVTAALQCAGNRRHAMRTRLKEVQGIDWFDAAILNAEWEGPLVADVLRDCGVKELGSEGDGAWHVAFACYSQKTQQDEWYGGSIPLERAMRRDWEVLLALKMNGETLNEKHGFPVRALVPGIIGARSVKWLDSITISRQESQNFYQQHDYKVLPPDATDATIAEEKGYWKKTPPMMDNLINSVVGDPEDGETVKRDANGNIRCKGYAIPGGDGGPIVNVEVSGDEGKIWVPAKLGPGTRWSWRLWECEVNIEKGEGRRLFSRAKDQKGNEQTEERGNWNLRGVGYNGYESTVNLTVL